MKKENIFGNWNDKEVTEAISEHFNKAFLKDLKEDNLEVPEGSLILSTDSTKERCQELFDDWMEETFEEKRTGVKAFIEDCCSHGRCVEPSEYGLELSYQQLYEIDFVFNSGCSDKTAARKIKKILNK